jgi:hypothetical protein
MALLLIGYYLKSCAVFEKVKMETNNYGVCIISMCGILLMNAWQLLISQLVELGHPLTHQPRAIVKSSK